MDSVHFDPGEPVAINPLPTNLGEAIVHLKHDKILLNALGYELAKAHLKADLAVRSAEWEAIKDLTLENELLEALLWQKRLVLNKPS